VVEEQEEEAQPVQPEQEAVPETEEEAQPEQAPACPAPAPTPAPECPPAADQPVDLAALGIQGAPSDADIQAAMAAGYGDISQAAGADKVGIPMAIMAVVAAFYVVA